MVERLDSKLVFKSNVFDVWEDEYVDDGNTYTKHIVTPTDRVAVLPVKDREHVILVRKYEEVVDDITLQIPSTIVQANETPARAFKRMLYEDMGYETGSWNHIYDISPDICYVNDIIRLYIADVFESDSVDVPSINEEDIVMLTKQDVVDALATGDIYEARTIIALQYAIMDNVI